MKSFVLQQGDNGVWYGIFPHLEKIGIKHGISTRLGGVSDQPFQSLNLGLHTGDVADGVRENRQRFCQAVGLNLAAVVTAEQVHDDHVALVTSEHIGKGSINYEEAIRQTDALITNLKDVPLMLFFADCVPVLIADPVKQVIGISHAGWKGTVAKIAQKTVMAMQRHFGTNPVDCCVGIGPSIGPCCYEVDQVVLEKLKANFVNWKQLVASSGERWQLDLWKANSVQLEEVGVAGSNIMESGVCTSCNTQLFFSHRAECGRTGRHGAVISLM